MKQPETPGTVKYSWKWGAPGGIPADVAGPIMEELSERNGGRIEKQELVDLARPAESPLHNAFTWDDAQAAEERRLDQAGYLIRSLEIRHVDVPGAPPEPNHKVRVFFKDPDTPRQFVNVRIVMSDQDLYEKIIGEVKEHIAELRDKVRALQDPRTRTLIQALDTALAA